MLPPVFVRYPGSRTVSECSTLSRSSSGGSSEKNYCDQTIPVPVFYCYSIIPFLKFFFFFRSSSGNNFLVSSAGFELE